MMGFKPILLWTDALLAVLMAALAVYVWAVRRSEPQRAAWKKVFTRRGAMASMVLLSVFLTFGVLDSIHFRLEIKSRPGKERIYGVEVLSLLDVILTHLRERPEKTYSAPLAVYLFSKETVEAPDGTRSRVFPRLNYGGAHLKDPEKERIGDILRRTGLGVLMGFGLWLPLVGAVCLGLSRTRRCPLISAARDLWTGREEIPWHIALVTILILLLAAGPIVLLSLKYHVLGTDKVGQDVLYQALKGIRTAWVIGTLTTLVMLPFAVVLGIMAGYFRGWVDDVIQYLYTTLNSVPAVLLIAAAVLMIQLYTDARPDWFETAAARADFRLLFLCLILGVTSWTGLCRLLRGEALKLREMEYVQAARALGVSDFKILFRHLLPNVMHIILIAVVMDFSGLVLAEAVLSYVGVGVDPTMVSFGTMINSARLEMAREPMVWWSLLAAFCFMLVLVLSANLFSDAVRDAFDPRLPVRPWRFGRRRKGGAGPKEEAGS